MACRLQALSPLEALEGMTRGAHLAELWAASLSEYNLLTPAIASLTAERDAAIARRNAADAQRNIAKAERDIAIAESAILANRIAEMQRKMKLVRRALVAMVQIKLGEYQDVNLNEEASVNQAASELFDKSETRRKLKEGS